MARTTSLLPLVLLCACATTTTAEGTAAPPSGAASVATASTAGGAALDPEIARTATKTDSVFKMKIRLDADGNVTKQSVYHRDAEAVPQAVRDLAAQKFPGATATHYETEVYADLGRVYEVELDDGGKKCELAATEEGAELYTECHVDPTQLGDAHKATIESIAPGGKILEAETKSGPDIPEETWVEVEQGDRELYLRLGADGSLIQAMRRVPAIVEVPLPTP